MRVLLTGTEYTGGLAALRALRAAGDVRSLVHQFRSGARRAALSGLLPQPNTTHAIVSFSDPRPGLSYLRGLPGRLRPSDRVLARAYPG